MTAPTAPNPLGPIQKAVAEKRYDDAIRLAEAAVAATPGSHELWNALGVGLRASGRPAEATGCYRRALDLRPGDIAASSNLANALKDLQRYREAVELHQRIVSTQPTSAAWTNLGVALHDGGQLADALAAFTQAVKLDPENASAHFDRAQILLRLARYDEGWKEFEWRWKLPDRPPMPNYPTPVWDGRPIPDGTLLVWPEQGFGDSILSMRFLPAVRRRVARIAVGCKPELLRLFQNIAGADELIPVGKAAPPHVAHAPVMGLAGHVMKSIADLPPPPRFHVPPESKARLAPILGAAGRRLKIGIVWSGSITFKANALRAVPLDRFLAFAEVPNVQLFSLQKGPRAADLAESGARNYIVDLGAHLEDFADTAAALEMLDLVIMTDSSVAHLAGSLGRPVWNLLPFMAYWLYLDGRTDSPWYPSMRIFRQRSPGDWDGVFAEAKAALAELARRPDRG